ncbi:MAG: hypothetical protein ACT443_14975 [Gemmatimonadota bacterium]
MGFRYKLLAMMAAALPLMASCGPSDEEKAIQAATDSMAAARARGEIDLSNPEMGAKMQVIITDTLLQQSHKEVPKGQLTIVVENKGTRPQFFEMRGENAAFKSLAIPAGGNVLMTVIADPAGIYALTCPDSVSGASRCGRAELIVRVGE